jgi:hypothetical protein
MEAVLTKPLYISGSFSGTTYLITSIRKAVLNRPKINITRFGITRFLFIEPLNTLQEYLTPK